MLLYQLAITLLLLLMLLNLLNNLRLFREPPHTGPLPEPLPLVSVLVPARNEEQNIGRCLESLLRQDYPRLEILVLDDNSGDRTSEIVQEIAAKDPRVRLLSGQPLQVGWHGKAFACHQLSREARGEWLLFTDADTVHAPSSVSASIRAAFQERADLLTYIPYLAAGSFWEKVILPLIAFFPLFLLPLGLVSRSSEPLFSMAFGPFLLFRASFYRAIGGHRAVRQEITEDMALGRLVKQHGGRLVLLNGVRVLSVRLYHNLGEIWRGLAKSAYAAFDFFLVGLLGLVGVNFLLFIGPYVLLYLALREGHWDRASWGWPVVQIVLPWVGRLLVARRLKMDRWPCFLHGLMMLVAIGLVFYSIWQAHFGPGIPWKGRVYSMEGNVLVHRRER
ncbi:MAG: glycosyltransferase [Chloroflexia bacterium]